MEADRQLPYEWLYVVRARIDPDTEEEWNDWYDNEHLPEILACPGFVHARRYVSRSKAGGTSYMTVYAITDASALETPEFASTKGWYRFANAVDFTTDIYRATSASR